MSGEIELRASPGDRLDLVAAAVRWWTSCLRETFALVRPRVMTSAEIDSVGGRRLSANLAIALPTDQMFVSRVSLPPGAPDAHRKALALRLAELAPLDPAELEVAARRESARSEEPCYVIAMARSSRLNELELAARRRGAGRVRFVAHDESDTWLETIRARRTRRRAAIVDMSLAVVLTAAAVIAATTSTRALEQETERLLEAEQELRRTAVARVQAERDAEIAEALVARGVLDRRAQALLDDLSALNAATPDSAWWTRVRWTPDAVTIVGASREAAAAIEILSTTAPGWRVELAGPVRSGGAEGEQVFELTLTRRGAADGG